MPGIYVAVIIVIIVSALNFIIRRFERCPHCKHWHWTEGLVKE